VFAFEVMEVEGEGEVVPPLFAFMIEEVEGESEWKVEGI